MIIQDTTKQLFWSTLARHTPDTLGCREKSWGGIRGESRKLRETSRGRIQKGVFSWDGASRLHLSMQLAKRELPAPSMTIVSDPGQMAWLAPQLLPSQEGLTP